MQAHQSSMEVQCAACNVLRTLTFRNDGNNRMAGAAGAVEAVVSAMLLHQSSAAVQLAACHALHNLTAGNDCNAAKARSAGAIDAVTSALRARAAGDTEFADIAGCVLAALLSVQMF